MYREHVKRLAAGTPDASWYLRGVRRFLSACLVALFVASGSLAGAQPPPSSDLASEAERLADQGFDAYRAGRYAEAIDRFRQADAKVHAPPFVLYLARSHEKLGRWTDAARLYETIVSEVLDSSAPAPFRAAQDDARRELQALRPRIPRLRVVLTGQPTEVTIDARQVAADEARSGVAVDPGAHTITARWPSGEARRSVTLAERAALAVDLAPPSDATTAPAPASGGRGSLLPAGIAFGFGGVGAVVGSVAGLMALGDASELKSRCVEGRCNPSDEPLRDSGRAKATVSTVGFVLGGIGVAAGVVLLVVRPGASSSTANPTALSIGPGGVTMMHRF